MGEDKKKDPTPRSSVWSASRAQRRQALENMDPEDREYYYKEIKESGKEEGE
ncbi:MAG: hypothetical protein GX376_03830 [Firmicutes bacterium]|nr:hypothetical protein [Bacillota bacterium]